MKNKSTASCIPPTTVRRSAARGLAWRAKYHRGGTMVGVARARDLKNGRAIPLQTIKRMHSYFARHAGDVEAMGWYRGERGFPSAGRIAWELWGGDAGAAWVERILDKKK